MHYFDLKSKEIDTILPHIEPSLLQIFRGRYLHRSIKIWKLYSLNTSYLEKNLQGHVLETNKNTL